MSYNNLVGGFQVTTPDPIDSRLVLSKTQMRYSILDIQMPDRYFCICSDDTKIYVYDKTNTVDPTTGKFRELIVENDFIIRGYYRNGNFYTTISGSELCEKNTKYLYADLSANGTLYTWSGTVFQRCLQLSGNSGQSETYTMTQKAITNAVSSIALRQDARESECLVLSLPW